MDKVSMPHEDYLEAIIMLGGTMQQSVRSVDIAKQMNVSKASVNKAIELLKEKGFVDKPYYSDVTLTKTGFEYGQSIYKRHRYLTAFLNKCLEIPSNVAEKEACQMEHAISDASFEKWATYIEKLNLVDEP